MPALVALQAMHAVGLALRHPAKTDLSATPSAIVTGASEKENAS